MKITKVISIEDREAIVELDASLQQGCVITHNFTDGDFLYVKEVDHFKHTLVNANTYSDLNWNITEGAEYFVVTHISGESEPKEVFKIKINKYPDWEELIVNNKIINLGHTLKTEDTVVALLKELNVNDNWDLEIIEINNEDYEQV